MVDIDYHVEVDKHYYLVSYILVKNQLEVHVTVELVQLYHQDKLVAVHPRAYGMKWHITNDQQHVDRT